MNTSEPTEFPTESSSLYNITYPEPTGNGSIIPSNYTSEQISSDIGFELLWISVTTVLGAIVTCLTCIGSIFLHNKCLADFENFRRGGEPHWLCEWMNREKYNKAREGQYFSRDPENPKAPETKDSDEDGHPRRSHTHIEMTFTSDLKTIHAVIDSNRAETDLAEETQILQDLLLRHTINEYAKQPPIDRVSISALEDGSLLVIGATEPVVMKDIGGGNNTAHDI